MAEPCEQFSSCLSLDAPLLINTAFQGPPLGLDLAELSLGAFATTGLAARPYIDVSVEQTWTPREACYGPVRSIFSLAPGETVQLQVLAEQRPSLAQTIADHLPDVIDPPNLTHVSSVGAALKAAAEGAWPQDPTPSSGGGGLTEPPMQILPLARSSRYIGAYGSFSFDPKDPFGVTKLVGGGGNGAPLPTPPTPTDVVGGLVKLVDGTTGGSQSAVGSAVSDIAKAAKAAGNTNAKHTRDETTTTSSDNVQQQRLTRTFTNPYRDRSLQLRFIPVFRRFEVTTTSSGVTAGVALQAGGFRQAEAGVSSLQSQLNSPLQLADVATASHPELQRRPATILSSTPGSGAHRALAWPAAELRGDSLLVPVAPPATAARALGVRGADRTTLVNALGKNLNAAIAAATDEHQFVHLFMGTHIEAVAGGCVLTDLPPLSAMVAAATGGT